MKTDEPSYAVIKALHTDVQPASFTLREDVCTIGRATICQIVVARSLVSRLHARIERTTLRYLLHDTDSANGTYVNRRRIQGPHLLRDRDQIGLGSPEPMLVFGDPDPTAMPTAQLRYDDQQLTFLLDGHPLELTVLLPRPGCCDTSTTTPAPSAPARAAPRRSGARSTSRAATPTVARGMSCFANTIADCRLQIAD